MWAAWAGGAGTGFALASMAAFYAAPRPTLDCVFGALGLPVDAAQTEAIADAIVDSYAGKRNRSQHVTSSRHDTARQEALLLSDATARRHRNAAGAARRAPEKPKPSTEPATRPKTPFLRMVDG